MKTSQDRPDEDSAETDRHAFNAAFEELGLVWHWDAATWQRVRAAGPEHQWLRAYLQADHPHLLRAYDADFLVGAILAAKARHCTAAALRPRREVLTRA